MKIDKYPKFLPQWTKAIEHIQSEKLFGLFKRSYDFTEATNKARIDFNLDWGNPKYCLTGEAFFHDTSLRWGCVKCEHFMLGDSHSALESIDGLYRYKEELAEHLQEKHPKTWDEWKEKMK